MPFTPLLLSASLVAGAPSDIEALRWDKRVLLVSAPSAADPRLAAQRHIVTRWKTGAAERDLLMVEVAASAVRGVSDSAATLRRRYRLPADRFVVVLIGKDGGSKLRATQPISAARLEETIDAMPMRRDGAR